MAYGHIGHEKNFIYINEKVLMDVQSVDYSVSTNRTVLNMAGVIDLPQVSEGVSQATLNLERYAITNTENDPFAGGFYGPDLFLNGFSGVWQHIDSVGENNFFAMDQAYVSNYTFSAALNEIPSISMGIVAYGSGIGDIYGSGIGQTDIPTGYMTGAPAIDFTNVYVYPKLMELVFPAEADTLTDIAKENLVTSFSLSFTMNREVRNRIGQQKKMPETFIAYPIEATLTIEIDVDEYTTPAINNLLCEYPGTIDLLIKNCDGSNIRGFKFTEGVLQSASMTERVLDINTATLEYTKSITSDAEFGFWIDERTL